MSRFDAALRGGGPLHYTGSVNGGIFLAELELPRAREGWWIGRSAGSGVARWEMRYRRRQAALIASGEAQDLV